MEGLRSWGCRRTVRWGKSPHEASSERRTIRPGSKSRNPGGQGPAGISSTVGPVAFALDLAAGLAPCAAALESDGYCDGCGGGIVAHRWYKGKEHYEKAEKARAIVVHAAQAAEKCETCGVAMLTNGECEHCHIKFEGGKKVG